ncbi:hypothetical protein SBDP1_1140002 [Syntrophobacter sp. SbD1]|nr:hypothetical protein SBDP1_1140002 [Syntrophobacter sp. SbD1]
MWRAAREFELLAGKVFYRELRDWRIEKLRGWPSKTKTWTGLTGLKEKIKDQRD